VLFYPLSTGVIPSEPRDDPSQWWPVLLSRSAMHPASCRSASFPSACAQNASDCPPCLRRLQRQAPMQIDAAGQPAVFSRKRQPVIHEYPV